MAQATESRAPRGFQFSIVKLLALIGWVAIVCVALKQPTPVWAAAMFLLAMLAVLASGLAILFRAGRARVFAVGFFAGCLGYATCLFVTEKHFGGQFGNENQLPTTQFANWMFQKVHPDSVYPYGGMGGFGGGMGGGGMGGGGMFSVDSSLTADEGSGDSGSADPLGVASDSQGDAGFGSSMDDGSGSGDGMGMGGMGDSGMMMSGAGQPPGIGAPVPAVPAPAPTIYYLSNFVVVVHSALAILLGLAGGVIAQVCHAARRESSPGHSGRLL
jgi:hypothetical protein